MTPVQIKNPISPGREKWVDDAGMRLVGVHNENDGCRDHGCALHNPTNHEYANYPLVWDNEERIFVRRISNKKSVPDPDELAFRERTGEEWLPS